ncbi:MAG: nucleotide sugar dehydrogenase [Gammaproteobacteria bacterium]|nr:nucleotide sugar dehydrogenase [Gammaproteobacteria bacterium]
MKLEESKIAVIGLGYVGLPLMVEFAKHFPTVGFDINEKRVRELAKGKDIMKDLSAAELQTATHGQFSYDPTLLADSNVYIVTVPTPVDQENRPDMSYLTNACELVGKALRAGDVVIFESTVYPGATEEACIPVLAKVSGLTFNTDFFVGYSPERINPGDKKRRLTNVIKVTSGSNPETLEFVDSLYGTIVTAGTHPASSIKVAEASKVIENTQRDLNIALVNELSIIFHRLGIDSEEVLEAAGTKWNFLNFRPGLVGGHCISVDPYYLTYKAQEIGYHPEVILAGRRINDEMGTYISERVVKEMTRNCIDVVDSNILVMGLAFKENCPDIRNTRVAELVKGLQGYHANVDIHAPWVSSESAMEEYSLNLVEEPQAEKYDAIVLAVAHDCFREAGLKQIRHYAKAQHVLFDVKYLFPRAENLTRL